MRLLIMLLICRAARGLGPSLRQATHLTTCALIMCVLTMCAPPHRVTITAVGVARPRARRPRVSGVVPVRRAPWPRGRCYSSCVLVQYGYVGHLARARRPQTWLGPASGGFWIMYINRAENRVYRGVSCNDALRDMGHGLTLGKRKA